MPCSTLTGFVTKKEACRRYHRSHRQLTRDLGTAMTVANEKVLSNFRLRTEDGELRDGTDVTTDVITKLRVEGKNPMWFVRAAWMEKTYGRRGEERPKPKSESSDESASRGVAEPPKDRSDVMALYTKRLEGENTHLHEELTIKNEQIRQSHDRQREMHLLTRDLHELMKDLQQRLPAASAAPKLPPPREAVVITKDVSETAPPEKGSPAPIQNVEHSQSKTATRPKPALTTRKSRPKQPVKPKKRKPETAPEPATKNRKPRPKPKPPKKNPSKPPTKPGPGKLSKLLTRFFHG